MTISDQQRPLFSSPYISFAQLGAMLSLRPMTQCHNSQSYAMGIGGQREGAEASVEKQYAHICDVVTWGESSQKYEASSLYLVEDFREFLSAARFSTNEEPRPTLL